MVSARQYHNVCSMVSARTGLLVLPELEQLTFFFASCCFIFSHFPLALLGARFSREEHLVRGPSQHPQLARRAASVWARDIPSATLAVSYQPSPVQFKMLSMRSDKPTCAPPRLSEVPPTLPLQQLSPGRKTTSYYYD